MLHAIRFSWTTSIAESQTVGRQSALDSPGSCHSTNPFTASLCLALVTFLNFVMFFQLHAQVDLFGPQTGVQKGAA